MRSKWMLCWVGLGQEHMDHIKYMLLTRPHPAKCYVGLGIFRTFGIKICIPAGCFVAGPSVAGPLIPRTFRPRPFEAGPFEDGRFFGRGTPYTHLIDMDLCWNFRTVYGGLGTE
jgi:hypothetical protein